MQGNGGDARKLEARPADRPALESWVREHGTLTEAAASRPGARPLQGRGRVHVVPAPSGEGKWVVRHYHRGGAVASLLGDRYLRAGRPRPFRELEVGWQLEERGVPTPGHVGAAVYPAGIWYRGDLVTEWVPDSRDLAAILFPSGAADATGAPDPPEAMEAAGRLVRLLHGRGVRHPDLNLKNILIAPVTGPAGVGAAAVSGGVGALVLDLDRASVGEPVAEAERRRMLDRFWRSARKWEAGTGRALGADATSAFEAGYAAGVARGGP